MVAAAQVVVWHGLHVVQLLAGMGRQRPWLRLRDDGDSDVEQGDGRVKGYYRLLPGSGYGSIGIPFSSKGERDSVPPVSRWSVVGLVLLTVLVLTGQVYLWGLVFGSSGSVDRVGSVVFLLFSLVNDLWSQTARHVSPSDGWMSHQWHEYTSVG
jgi:hypothetical protein